MVDSSSNNRRYIKIKEMMKLVKCDFKDVTFLMYKKEMADVKSVEWMTAGKTDLTVITV